MEVVVLGSRAARRRGGASVPTSPRLYQYEEVICNMFPRVGHPQTDILNLLRTALPPVLASATSR